ncbi:MAG: hypothetical protein R2764_26085 [Bacteroidales bacterium]
MKKKLICFLCLLLLSNSSVFSEGIEFQGRYVFRRAGNLEFITEDFYLNFHVHQNVINKFGTSVWDDFFANCVEISNVTGSYANITGLMETVSTPLDQIYESQGISGVFESQFNLIAIDEQNKYTHFSIDFNYGDPLAVAVTHILQTQCTDPGYGIFSPIIVETDIGINPWATIKAKTTIHGTGEDPYYCFRQILLHEYGHALGLRHNSVDAGVMIDEVDTEFFIYWLSNAEREALVQLYSGENGPLTPKNLCENFNTSALSYCKGVSSAGGGGCGSCGGGTCTVTCNQAKSRSGISDVALQNIVKFYIQLDNQPDFDSLISIAIENISLFEGAIDDQVQFSGNINEGGMTVNTENEVPSNRIASNSTSVFYENYPEFNRKLQIAINEFIPIINKDFNCDCDASSTHLDSRQIYILKDLISEVKKMPVSEGLKVELTRLDEYLNNRQDNNIKTDIINYLNLY